MRLFASAIPLRASFVACEQSLQSPLVVARHSSFRALFRASKSYSRTRSPLPCQRSFSKRLPQTILPSSSGGVGLHRLASVASVGRCRIGSAESDLFHPNPSVSRVVRLNAAEKLLADEAVFLRKVAGNVWASRKVVEGQDRCSFLKPSMACQRLGPERRCPLTRPCPSRGTIQETKTGRPTLALKRTADAFSTGRGRGMGVAVSQLGW